MLVDELSKNSAPKGSKDAVNLVDEKLSNLTPCIMHLDPKDIDFNNSDKEGKEATEDPDFKSLLKKDLAKDLVPPAMENVTAPFPWTGPKKETPDWKKCMALNTRVKEGSDEVLKR